MRQFCIKMAAAAQWRCEVGAFARNKPVIYQTVDGQTIVEDKLLNFLLIKSRTLDQDNIIKIVKTSFSSQRIEASKDTKAELFPDSKRWTVHRGEKKDELYIKMCLAVFKVMGELGPRFVSHFIDELPPISLKHVDVSVLLGRRQQINNDIELLKESLTSQAAVSEKLLEVSGSINQRLVAVENTATGTTGGGVGSSVAARKAVTTLRSRPVEEGFSSGGSVLSPRPAMAEDTAARQWGPSPSARKTLQRGRS